MQRAEPEFLEATAEREPEEHRGDGDKRAPDAEISVGALVGAEGVGIEQAQDEPRAQHSQDEHESAPSLPLDHRTESHTFSSSMGPATVQLAAPRKTMRRHCHTRGHTVPPAWTDEIALRTLAAVPPTRDTSNAIGHGAWTGSG